MMKEYHYSMIIQWDEDDKIFVVSVPELPGCMTHGKTYEEAIKNALEVMELWLETAKDLGWPIPKPRVGTLEHNKNTTLYAQLPNQKAEKKA